jgi:hypothetical protein
MVMSPLGFGIKNHCAGEGQQQFSSQEFVKRYNKHSAYIEGLISPLVEDEAPFLNTYISRREQKPWS